MNSKAAHVASQATLCPTFTSNRANARQTNYPAAVQPPSNTMIFGVPIKWQIRATTNYSLNNSIPSLEELRGATSLRQKDA